MSFLVRQRPPDNFLAYEIVLDKHDVMQLNEPPYIPDLTTAGRLYPISQTGYLKEARFFDTDNIKESLASETKTILKYNFAISSKQLHRRTKKKNVLHHKELTPKH